MSDQEDRDTLPPNPATEPPPFQTMIPPVRAPSISGHEMLDDAIASVVEAARVVKSYHDELHADDGPFARQTARISGIVEANYGLIHSDVRAMKATVDALSHRMSHAEDRLDSGSSRFAEIDGEIAGLRRQLTRLASEVESLKNAATSVPPTPTTTTG